MSLAAAAWLWCGLALAVPAVLHLLGRGRGETVRWPSVVLLREAAMASGVRFRPSQLWLLLLRCTLLAMLTLALAEPVVARRAAGGTVWLVEPGLDRELPHGGGSGVEPEIRYLAPGLPATAPVSRGPQDLWSLLVEADHLFPAGISFHVVARPRLDALLGARPRLAHAVVWQPAMESVATAGAAAAAGSRAVPAPAATGAPLPAELTGAGQATALAGVAPAAATGAVPPVAPTGGGSAAATGAGPAAAPRERPIRQVRLAIAATPARAADAAALRDNLVRAGSVLGWAVAVMQAGTDLGGPAAPMRSGAGSGLPAAAASGDAGAADVLASLGEAAPADWTARVQRGATLLREGDGDPAGAPAAAGTPRGSAGAPANAGTTGRSAPCFSLVATRCCGLFERTLCGPEPAGEAVWRDGSGKTVLSRTRLGSGSVQTYAGRFAPGVADWSRGAYIDLLQEAVGAAATFPPAAETSVAQALPQSAVGGAGAGSAASPTVHVHGASTSGDGAAAGRAASGTAAPALGASGDAGGAGSLLGASGGGGSRSLAAPLWLAVGLLFAAERWLAGRAARRGGAQPR